MHIGRFTAAGGGFVGRLHLMTQHVEMTLVPASLSDSDNTPDFRVLAGTQDELREIGAGWKQVGEKAGDYISILIDDPTFCQPIRANLFPGDSNAYVLVWSRAPRRDGAS